MQFEEIRDRLLQEDESFRQLVSEHRQHDEELRELGRRRYLSPDDQLREIELKKLKLSLKDRMMERVSEYRQQHTPDPGPSQ